ncbi:MAG: cytochrome c biogenesis protein [Haloarculaceae archaeon]
MRRVRGVVCLALGVVVLAGVVPAFGGATAPHPTPALPVDDRAATLSAGSTDRPVTGSVNGTTASCYVYFYSPSCPHCGDVTAHLDSRAANATVRRYVAAEHPERFRAYLRAYGVPTERWGTVPALFTGDRYAVGERAAKSLVDATAGNGTRCLAPDEVDDAAGVTAGTCRLNGECTAGGGVSLATIGGLALVDAVNPCALAVLLILLTTVATTAEGDRSVLVAGLSFAAAIFAVYFALGLLIVAGFSSVQSVAGVDTGLLYRAVGGLAVVLGLLNLKDGISHGFGGFAMEVPFSWRPRMQRSLTKPLWSDRAIPVSAFLSGVFVSLFLLPCTSGPYFVAGGLLAAAPWDRVALALGAYNLVFVLPMVGITLLVYGGFVSATAVSDWREEHVETLHLVAGVVLVALGLYVAFA